MGNVIFTYRSNLTTAIDALAHLGVALNGNKCVAANQSRVSVSVDTLTGTEYITLNNGFTCTGLGAYCNSCVVLYTAYLTASINSTFDCTVMNGNICSLRALYHGACAGERVGNTLTAAKYVTGYSGSLTGAFTICGICRFKSGP